MIIRLIIAGIIVRAVMLILQWENERPRKEGKKQTSSIYKFDMRCPIYICGLGGVCGLMSVALLIGIYFQEGYINIASGISMGILLLISIYGVLLPIPRMWDQRVEQDDVIIRRFIIYERHWHISDITYCKMTKGGMLKVYVKERKRMAFSVDPMLIGKKNFMERMKRENIQIYDAEGQEITGRKKMIYEYDAKGSTKEAVKIYKENKNRIGEIQSANMRIIDDEPVLSLYDVCEDELRIVSGLASGYGGEGPHGLLWILRDAGFEIKDQFIYENETFNIKKF